MNGVALFLQESLGQGNSLGQPSWLSFLRNYRITRLEACATAKVRLHRRVRGWYTAAMPQLEHIEAIEKRLWGAADTLRANSNYASNEYFLPVMGSSGSTTSSRRVGDWSRWHGIL